ncbi:hypothetical protein [Isoptericola sp. b408]|uniref:8-oxoguanine DNA glycosylase OGG fold protein n=1 Tax=Isoptericola sp. b408 TaxID=3064653 RepID=UPI0027139229|nr:hypothetical protein [Isoptericola sp. b408]MDO8151849.1 hypothetical protein [Isoptericola sp. b408]
MATRLAGGQSLLDRLPGREALLEQDVRFRPRWWTTRVPASGWLDDLPEDPPGGDYRRISRGRVLDAADGSDDWEARTLLAAGVWSAGDRALVASRGARALGGTEPSELLSRLRLAAKHLGTGRGAVDAYRSMLRGGSAHVKHLGPTLISTYLYAADFGNRGGVRGGDALVLDRFVVRALNDHHGWSVPEDGPWSADLYARWLDVATEQAWLAAIELGRTVRGDEMEFAYAAHGKSLG